jgi:hypothetical protein
MNDKTHSEILSSNGAKSLESLTTIDFVSAGIVYSLE